MSSLQFSILLGFLIAFSVYSNIYIYFVVSRMNKRLSRVEELAHQCGKFILKAQEVKYRASIEKLMESDSGIGKA